MKILVVEDDEFIAQTLTKILRDRHYIVDLASEGELGWEFVEAYDYDLILLDIVLPKLNGIEFCKRLRSRGDRTPVLLLTAQNSSNKKVIGLDAGADDYVVKPFEISELLARIRVLLRRRNSLTAPILRWGKLSLNSSTHEVTYDEEILTLTPKEYRLLELFLDRNDSVLTRDLILDRLWSIEEAPSKNAVSAHIKQLRRKLKQAGADADWLETIYDVGYRLKPLAKAAAPSKASQQTEKLTRQETKASLAAVWQKFESLNSERLEILERANRAWQEDRLQGHLLQQAKWSAHRLAGGLGIFGFSEGSRLATKIEELLKIRATSELERARYFSQLLIALKNSVKPHSPPQPNIVRVHRPIIFAVDRHPKLVRKIVAEGGALAMNLEMVAELADLQRALSDPSLELVVWQFSLRELTETSLIRFVATVNHLPLTIILFTDNDNLSERLKFVRCANNILLQPASLSDLAITALVKAVERLQNQVVKVLVVDDDPQVLASLHNWFEPWKIDLTTLEDPQQFWYVIAQLDPDLLILDVAMPEINGIDLCRLVLTEPRWHELPILFFTVHNDLSTMYRALTAGADDYLSKTLTQSEMVTKMFNYLNRVQLLRAI
ncbi:response regulator [Myxosarcina sp. GI1(2024)]